MVATAILVYEAQPYRPVVVSGVSMSPTYTDHEFLVADSNIGDLKRGDVVIINTSTGPIIKRVALLPGEHFYRMKYLGISSDLIEIRPPFSTNTVVQKVTVPADSVYVLGDNLTVSIDSRKLGFIPISSIRGKVLDQRPLPTIPVGLLAAYSHKPVNHRVPAGI